MMTVMEFPGRSAILMSEGVTVVDVIVNSKATRGHTPYVRDLVIETYSDKHFILYGFMEIWDFHDDIIHPKPTPNSDLIYCDTPGTITVEKLRLNSLKNFVRTGRPWRKISVRKEVPLDGWEQRRKLEDFRLEMFGPLRIHHNF